MHNYHDSYNYINECASLNTNIPRPLSERIPPIKNTRSLSLTELLQFNLNQVVVMDYNHESIKGVLEYVGDTYIILHDLKLQTKTLYFIAHIGSITFEDDIRYTK